MTSINGNIQGYYYQEGYLRTSSREFGLNNLNDKMVHLTNDAIQQKATDYGKFENGNKLSYAEFEAYLQTYHPDVCLISILSQIRDIVRTTMKAMAHKLDVNYR